jgi:lysophospholipase L1-like esterase
VHRQLTQDRCESRRVVRKLVVLGDSTSVGVGDPIPGRNWRGFAPMLAEALGAERPADLTNLATTGARIGCVRERQLSKALRARPDAVVLVVGMNDSMRSDFNPRALHAQLDETVGALRATGAAVVTARYHDHAKVFRLPGSLRRALDRRITILNEINDAVAERHGARVVDLDALPGAYEPSTWSVDRLHPSERGHRLLATAFAGQLRQAGYAVPRPVSLRCEGGMTPSTAEHVLWLLLKGLPWLWRRGHDLVPYALGVMIRSVLRFEHRTDSAATEFAIGAWSGGCPAESPVARAS